MKIEETVLALFTKLSSHSRVLTAGGVSWCSTWGWGPAYNFLGCLLISNAKKMSENPQLF